MKAIHGGKTKNDKIDSFTGVSEINGNGGREPATDAVSGRSWV